MLARGDAVRQTNVTHAPKLSVCIPAYGMNGQGAAFLAESFARLAEQDLAGFEVVVSDQCEDDAIARLCADWQARLPLRRVDFADGPRQASANTNNAMRAARGEIVKILFQDDLLNGPDALGRIVAGFGATTTWLLCGSDVTRTGAPLGRAMVPRMHPQIRFGRNTVSSPSVLAMRRTARLDFDETLIWLMDVEMFHRLNATYGAPAVVPEPLVLNRLHPGQVSATVTPVLRRSELNYVREKYKSEERFRDRFSFWHQIWKAR
ncbi:MAG: glycosyltransferase [Pseudomonadota bacterium]